LFFAGNPDMRSSPQLPLALKLRQGKCFDNFVSSQPELLLLLQALADGEQTQLYLHGIAGTGKSHLLEACVVQVESQGKGACLFSAPLLHELAPSVLEGMESFSLLAIDDVDALAGHTEWENALFHLYNRVYQEGGRLLFAARQAPRHAGFQLPDLVTRLGAGPVMSLAMPDENALMKLVKLSAQAKGLFVEADLARFLISRAPRQPAALESMLEQLDHASLATQRRLTIPFVKQQFGW
jgi:DnaA family protein